MSSIVSKALDDSMDDNSESGASSEDNSPTGGMPQAQPLYGGAGARTGLLTKPAASVADTSD
eukprot:scaffold651878_cov46-Prasinocladus_malaysianus.AAC.1